MPTRKIPSLEQLTKDSQELFEVLNCEKDLPVILVASSFLDACLGAILACKFIKSTVTESLLNPRDGMLGNYSVRADVCYSLGLLPKRLYQDLLKINEIRNAVAHHHHAMSFEEESIQKLCSELGYAASLKDGGTDALPGFISRIKGARRQFVVATVMISQRLLQIGVALKPACRKAAEPERRP